MNDAQDILYGVTSQTLVFDAPEGRPSSVTSMDVFPMTSGDDATAEPALGAAAVETNPNTTVDATSGYGETDPRKVNLTATTGIAIGRSYLLTNITSGESEWVEVVEIVSADYVLAREPLLNSYPTSSTFVSTRISATVDSTWVADSTNITDDLDPNPGYRCRVQYVVASQTYVHHVEFDLVRYQGRHTVTPVDMVRFHPGWNHELPTYHQPDGGKQLIAEAYKQVKWDLHAAGHADEGLRSIEGVNQLVKHKAWVLLARGQGEQMLELARREYQAQLDRLVQVTNRLPMATDASGAGNDVAAHGIWSK